LGLRGLSFGGGCDFDFGLSGGGDFTGGLDGVFRLHEEELQPFPVRSTVKGTYSFGGFAGLKPVSSHGQSVSPQVHTHPPSECASLQKRTSLQCGGLA
jgi:hypothetical protein